VSDGSIRYEGDRFREELRARLKGKFGRPGDVVITTKGASTGRTAFVGKEAPEFVYSPHLSFWRSRQADELDPTFLRYWARSSSCAEQVTAMAASTDMSLYLSLVDQRRLRIALPPLAGQRAIGGILGVLDDKIELNRRMNETLAAIIRAIFHRTIGAGRPTSFSEIVEIRGGGTPKTSEASYWGGGIPWFSVVDTPGRDELYVISTDRTLTEAGLASCSAELVPVGSTIISARGTVGNLALAGVRIAFNQSCYGLLPAEGFGSFFVYLSTERLVETLRQRSHGSVFDTITRSTFEGVETPLPSREAVVAFETEVAPYFARVLHCVRESRTLADLRDALLPKLISGELRVRDAETAVETGAEPKQT
jgi:type I restriction enzyme S subunit